MFNFKNLFFTLLVLSAFTSYAFPQMPKSNSQASSPESTKAAENFVSPDGEFTIALPRVINDFRKINPGVGISGGSQFFWKRGESLFFVSFYGKDSKVEDAQLELQSLSESMLADFIAKGGKLLSRKEIFLNKHPGMEVKILLKEGETALFRYYLVNNRVYVLSTRWNQTEDGAAQLKVLDSFKLTGKSRN